MRRQHTVVGVDNLSKYGRVAKSYDDDPGYLFVEGDARDAHNCAVVITAIPKRMSGRGRPVFRGRPASPGTAGVSPALLGA